MFVHVMNTRHTESIHMADVCASYIYVHELMCEFINEAGKGRNLDIMNFTAQL